MQGAGKERGKNGEKEAGGNKEGRTGERGSKRERVREGKRKRELERGGEREGERVQRDDKDSVLLSDSCGVATSTRLLKSVGLFCRTYFMQNIFYRALLQKRAIILRKVLIVATPYREICLHAV